MSLGVALRTVALIAVASFLLVRMMNTPMFEPDRYLSGHFHFQELLGRDEAVRRFLSQVP